MMSRGLTDPVVEQVDSSGPSVAEMDRAIVQLFEIVNDLQVQIDVLKDVLGASIGSRGRDESRVTGL